MIYGYARVSTKGQANYGNGLEEQIQELERAGADVIFKDAYTGTKTDRPAFSKLLSSISSGDTLVVTKLDRIARSASQGAELVKSLLERGVAVNVLNMGMINDTPTGRLTLNIFFAFAEFERDMIVQRTTEGKAIARQKPDYKEGRPRKNPEGFSEIAEKIKKGDLTVKEGCEILKISRGTYYNTLKRA